MVRACQRRCARLPVQCWLCESRRQVHSVRQGHLSCNVGRARGIRVRIVCRRQILRCPGRQRGDRLRAMHLRHVFSDSWRNVGRYLRAVQHRHVASGQRRQRRLPHRLSRGQNWHPPQLHRLSRGQVQGQHGVPRVCLRGLSCSLDKRHGRCLLRVRSRIHWPQWRIVRGVCGWDVQGCTRSPTVPGLSCRQVLRGGRSRNGVSGLHQRQVSGRQRRHLPRRMCAVSTRQVFE